MKVMSNEIQNQQEMEPTNAIEPTMEPGVTSVTGPEIICCTIVVLPYIVEKRLIMSLASRWYTVACSAAR
jgi:hypothetical protein